LKNQKEKGKVWKREQGRRATRRGAVDVWGAGKSGKVIFKLEFVTTEKRVGLNGGRKQFQSHNKGWEEALYKWGKRPSGTLLRRNGVGAEVK